jgi:hypothetical protein
VLTIGLPFIAALTKAAGGKVKVLAWAEYGSAPDSGYIVALLDRLGFSTAGVWTFLDWAAIERGGWDGAQQKLNVVAGDGQEYGFTLAAPGHLPEVFLERVNASIVFSRHLEVGGGTAVIAKRRNPADPSDEGQWRITTSAELTPADPALLAELERLRAEFE